MKLFSWETDLQGKFRWISDDIDQLNGLSARDMLAGGGGFASHSPEHLRSGWAAFGGLTATNPSPVTGFLHAVNDSAGQPVWLTSSAVPVRDSTGRMSGFRGTSRLSRETAKSDELLAGLFREMVDPVVIVETIRTPDGQPDAYLLVKVNPAFERLCGRDRSELEGRTVLETFPQLDRQVLEKCVRQCPSDEPLRTEMYSPSFGRYLQVTTFSSAPLRFVCIMADITEKRELTEQLKVSEERLQLAIRGTNEGIWDWNLRTNELYLSPTWKEMLGFEDHELPNEYQTFESRLHPEDKPRVLKLVDDYLTRRVSTYEAEFRFLHRDGSWNWILARGEALFDAEGQPYRMAGSHCDITARKENELRLSLFSKVFENSQDALMLTDSNNLIVEVNPAFTRITGYSAEEVIGRDPKLLSSGRQPASFYKELWNSLQKEGRWSGEVWNRRKNGEFYAEFLSIFAISDHVKGLQYYLGIFSDVTRQKQYREELDRLANYDTLTGLPNLQLLYDRMKQAVETSRNSGASVAICALDVDDFKPINEAYGHQIGDRILVGFSQRIEKALRKSDTLARCGGDDFALVLRDIKDSSEVEEILERVLRSLEEPFRFEDCTIELSASIGVALYPDDDVEPETLLRDADRALYEAKCLGKNRFVFFDSERERRRTAHYLEIQELQRALSGEQFVLFYQPKVDLTSGRVIGAEALIRWQHPTRGLLPPGVFLGTVMNSELELPVGRWVASTAISRLSEWRARGLDLIVSINVSPLQLFQNDFLSDLESLLQEYPTIGPADLELEILESTAISEMSRAVDVIEEGRDRGFRFSLDDFGTGYSSLAHFRQLPVDVLKVDRSFVQNMTESPEDHEIVDSIIRLAHAFNREVIAEGVETVEQGRALLGLGCSLGQGYGLGMPMSGEDFLAWLEGWERENPWQN